MPTTSADAIVLHLHGAIAIPVGHHVEVRVYYSAGEKGLLGVGHTEPAPMFDMPLVTDLDTGIGYGHIHLFHAHEGASARAGTVLTVSLAPLPELREHSRWVGKVTGCTVLYQGIASQSRELQTTLVLERDGAPAPAYR